MRRLLVGMSQQKMGELLGITFQQVQKYEKGLNRIGASRLYKIAGILGVPIQFLYDKLQDETRSDRDSTTNEGADLILETLRSPEGVQLARLFSQTKDDDLRKLMLGVVRMIVGSA